MLHCNMPLVLYVRPADQGPSPTMSRQLAIASAFSIFALSALALFAPGSPRVAGLPSKGATIEIAAPALTARLPFTN
jgi:hypothetical protein